MVGYVEGVLQIANVFLIIVAGLTAITLFKVSGAKKHLRAWRPLIIVLILFAVEEILGALRSFDIYSTPHLTHIVPSLMLGFLIYALTQQIIVSKYTTKV